MNARSFSGILASGEAADAEGWWFGVPLVSAGPEGLGISGASLRAGASTNQAITTTKVATPPAAHIRGGSAAIFFPISSARPSFGLIFPFGFISLSTTPPKTVGSASLFRLRPENRMRQPTLSYADRTLH